MVAGAYPAHPERIAWRVLLGAFFTFVLLLLTLVVGGNWWLRNATSNQAISMVSSGTVLVTRPGRSAPEANLPEFPPASALVTAENASAIVSFTSADTRQVLASVQVFGDTQLQIEHANSARFRTNHQPHRIVLRLIGGRIRSYVAVDVDRPVQLIILSEPSVTTVLEVPGSNASVEASFSESMVTVREGQALVTAQDRSVPLSKDQRAEVPVGSAPLGPLPSDRNLLRNGDFTRPLDGEWRVEVAAPLDPFESAGEVEITTIGGRRTISFARTGTRNWGRLSITQEINQSVLPFSSMRLHLDLYLAHQDLWNCGLQGTECPFTVRIIYQDIYGNTREWLQGFYYNYNPNPTLGATFCVTCAPAIRERGHHQWPYARWQAYDSPNLLELFAEGGAPAATVRSITLQGEGHEFISFAADVQLLVSE
jgi:hypothetical protein